MLAARVMQSAAFGALVSLLLAGTLHIPATFFLVLSFPPAWIGFAALLGALHCHLTYLRRPGLASGLLTGTLYLLAALMHDVFIVYLPLFVALSWLQEKTARVSFAATKPDSPGGRAGLLWPCIAASPGNFRRATRARQFYLDALVAAKVLLRQLIGIVPGFELLVHRLPADTTGPLFRPLSASS